MTRHLFLLLFITLTIINIGICNDSLHITFTPPKGWTKADTDKLPPSVKIMVVGKSSTSIPPSINLGIEPYERTLNDYLKNVKKINLDLGAEWEDLGTIRVPAGTASLSQVDAQTEWGKMRMMHIILVQNKHAFVLTAAALKEDFSRHYEAFFECFRSLRFLDTQDPQEKEKISL